MKVSDGSRTSQNSQLNAFIEASQGAHGALAYQGNDYESSQITICFCDVKGQGRPLESIRIPRLELMATIVGLQIAETA